MLKSTIKKRKECVVPDFKGFVRVVQWLVYQSSKLRIRVRFPLRALSSKQDLVVSDGRDDVNINRQRNLILSPFRLVA